jgi:phosphatidylglycerophosphate synthase
MSGSADDGMFWRKYSDPFLAATVLKLIPQRVTPNQVSWLRVFSWPVVFYFLFIESYVLGFLIFLFSAFTDLVDGAMARTRDKITEFGKVLDPVADRGLIAVAGFILISRLFGWPLFFYMLVLEIFQAIMSYRAMIRLGYNPGSNWAGAVRMFIQSVAFIMIIAGLSFFLSGWITFAGILLYISLLFTFLAAFLYKS